MKKIFLCLALMAGVGMTTRAQQLPNVGFESWKGSGNAGSTYQSSSGKLDGSGSSNVGMQVRPGDEPVGWYGSSINQKVTLSKKQELIFKEGNTSNYFAKLVNTFVGVLGVGSNAPAFLTFGTPWVYAVSNISNCDGGTYGGMEFTNKPDAIRGKYKKTPASKAEPSYIIVYIWKGIYTSEIASSSSADADKYRDDVDRAIMGSVSETGVAAPSNVTSSGKLIAWCNYAFKNTTTADADWEIIEVPLNYVSANLSETPSKMNVVICAGDYWSRDNIQDGTTLEVDDVEFVYYSELATATYDGTALAPVANGTIEVADCYDAAKLSLTSNGHGASIEKAYNEEDAKLTITVKGEDISVNASNKHTYTIQFAKKGDVNGDKSVTIADVTALVNIILGKADGSKVADINGDGTTTIADVTALVNIILGK